VDFLITEGCFEQRGEGLMTKFYLVRHGETTYKYVDERGFIGHGRDLAQRTITGINQLNQH